MTVRQRSVVGLAGSRRAGGDRPNADARAVRAVSRKRSSIHEVRLQQKVEKIKYLGSRCHARHAERRVLADTPRFAP